MMMEQRTPTAAAAASICQSCWRFRPRHATPILVGVAAWLVLGCGEQQSGGVLGSLNDSGNSAPVDPLALPDRQTDASARADEERALRRWITDALTRSARIELQAGTGLRAIQARVRHSPALVGEAALVWSFGDGQFAYGMDVRHTYASVGTYAITVAIAGSLAGPIQFDRVRVAVSDDAIEEQEDSNEPIAAAAVSPREGAAPLVVYCDGSLSAPGSGSSLTYSWDFGDGASAQGAVTSHEFATEGVFGVSLTVRDEAGRTATSIVTVNVGPASGQPVVPTQPTNPFDDPLPDPVTNPEPVEPEPPEVPTPPLDPPPGSQPVDPPAQSQPANPPASQPQDPPATQPAPPPATMPMPARTFLGYLPDGGYRVQDGFSPPVYRPIGISAMPQLAAYGFSRYMSPAYMGIARSLEDARSYHQPLANAARAVGMRWIPGFFLHHIVDNLYGIPSDPPWNRSGPDYDLNHPMNPAALGEQRFWDELVNRTRILATGADSNQVYIDSEFVFWHHRTDAFWTDANLAIIRPMVRDAVARLQAEGIFLVMYHPFVNTSAPDIQRIALTLFSPDSPQDPLTNVEHFAPSPFVRIANYIVPEPVQTLAPYLNAGFQAYQVSYGFISDHAYGGFNAQQYDAYCTARPGLAEYTWFFCTGATVTRHAAAFAALASP